MDIQNSQQPQRSLPAGSAPAASLPASSAAAVSFSFTGTGGELLGEALISFLLTAITFGLYAPWMLVRIQKYFYSRTTINTPAGPLQVAFTGTGGLCLIEVYLTALLVPLTFGIYTPWYVASVGRFFSNNSIATGADGRQYRLNFGATGGDLILPMIIGGLLSSITFGIYLPWFICNLRKLVMDKLTIRAVSPQSSEQIGRFEFVGTGGGLIGTFLLGMILTGITFGIYMPWFQVNLQKFYLRNTGIHVGSRSYRGDFTGTGGELLWLMLSGILIPLTFGMYVFWLVVKQQRFSLGNTKFHAA